MGRERLQLDFNAYLNHAAHLTTQQHGAFLLLAIHAKRWGTVPTDEPSLARIAKMPVNPFHAVWPAISALFICRPEGCYLRASSGVR